MSSLSSTAKSLKPSISSSPFFLLLQKKGKLTTVMNSIICSSAVSYSTSFPKQITKLPSSSSSSLSWSSSIPNRKSLAFNFSASSSAALGQRQMIIICAAWTRRSRGEAAKRPNRKSWKQRTDMYMRPFMLNVFFSKRFIHAKVMHRGTSKVMSVASTNARDLRNTLPSLIDDDACRTVGQLIAERSKEADIYAMSYEPKKNERIEGKLGIVIDTIKENGIIFV